jgi:hypothetical protein
VTVRAVVGKHARLAIVVIRFAKRGSRGRTGGQTLTGRARRLATRQRVVDARVVAAIARKRFLAVDARAFGFGARYAIAVEFGA